MWMGIRNVSYPALLSIMLVKLLFPGLPRVWAIKLSLYLATGVVVLDLLAGILRLPQRLQQQPKEARIFAIGATPMVCSKLSSDSPLPTYPCNELPPDHRSIRRP